MPEKFHRQLSWLNEQIGSLRRNRELGRALEEQFGVPAEKLPQFLEATGLTARQLEKRLLPWRRLKSLFHVKHDA